MTINLNQSESKINSLCMNINGLMNFFQLLKFLWGIEFKDKTVTLKEGEMIVVKKGEQHKPFAFEECKRFIVEPRGVVNTGESYGNLTSENDIWIQNGFKLYQEGEINF